MTDTIAYGVALLALLVAVFAATHTVRDAPFGNPLFYAVSVLEIVLVVAMVGGFVALAQTDRDVSGGLYVSYWLTGVVVVALLTVAALMVRLLGIWKGTYV